MKNIMVILKHNLKSIMKWWFVLILILPIGVNVFVSGIMNKMDSNSSNGFNVAIYTKDNSEIVDIVIPQDKFSTLFIANSEEGLKGVLDSGDVSVGVIINSGDLYKDLKDNKDGVIEVLTKRESVNKEFVLNLINKGITQVMSYGDSKEEVLTNYKESQKNGYEFVYESNKLEEIIGYSTMFGLFTMAFLFIAGWGINPILKERELKIDKRILVSKVSKVEYALGHILGCFMLLLAQSITLVGSFYLLNSDFNISLGWMIVLSFVLSFMGIAVALIVLSVSNSSSMYYTLLSVIVTPMALLSGGFVPTSFMPEMVQNFSLILPLTWIHSAFNKILMGSSYSSIALDLLAAMAISLVLIMLYLFAEHKRKTDVNY